MWIDLRPALKPKSTTDAFLRTDRKL